MEGPEWEDDDRSYIYWDGYPDKRWFVDSCVALVVAKALTPKCFKFQTDHYD